MSMGYVYLVSAAVLWGTIGIGYGLGRRAGADYEWLITGRPLLAAVVALAYTIYTWRRPSFWSMVIGLAALGPLYAVYPLSIARIGAGLASILLYTAPIWVNLFSYKFLGESLTARKILALVLGIAGVALISLPGGLVYVEPLGLLLGLASGFTYALYIFLARVAVVKGTPVHEVSMGSILFSALVVLLVFHPANPPRLVDIPYIVYLAVACTILPYYLNVKGLESVEAGRASLISLVEPVVALVLAHTVLGEMLTVSQLLGSTLVLTAVVLAMLG